MKPVRVDPNGAVPMSYVKDPLKLGGLSLAEGEKAIGQTLQKAGVIDHPNVWIDRMERGDAASVALGPIAPGDVVRVSLVELIGPGAEQVRNFHVSEAGAIGLPFLGQTKIAGMSEADAEHAIREGYEKASVAQNIVVSVLRVKLPPGPEPMPMSEISNARVTK